MPFLGVEPVQEFASVAKQTITGTGATAYSLTHSVGSANDLAVFVNNVRQEPASAYTASGDTITFTSALASTDSCYIVYIARTFQTAVPEDNSINADQISYPLTNFSSTGIDDNADATAITISSAEKVGINNPSPSELLSMIGTGGTAKVRFDGDSSNLQNNFIGITGYDDLIIASDEANSGTASTIQFRVDAAERMRIDSAGDVGIGISDPLYKLQVAGVTADADGALGSQSPQFSIQGGNANNQFEFGMDNSGGTAIGFIQSRNLAAGAQTLSLNPAGGSVLIGKTNKASANYGVFQVQQSAVGAVGYFEINASGGSQNAVDIVNAANANFQPLRFWTNGYSGTPVGTIACTSSSTAYNTSSDYRLKENIVDLDNAINRIKQIPVHQFNFIVEPDVTVDGFLAHEVADIVPEAITGTKDGVDDKGNPEYQGIDQSKLVPLLTKAIQELEARVTALEAS